MKEKYTRLTEQIGSKGCEEYTLQQAKSFAVLVSSSEDWARAEEGAAGNEEGNSAEDQVMESGVSSA